VLCYINVENGGLHSLPLRVSPPEVIVLDLFSRDRIFYVVNRRKSSIGVSLQLVELNIQLLDATQRFYSFDFLP